MKKAVRPVLKIVHIKNRHFNLPQNTFLYIIHSKLLIYIGSEYIRIRVKNFFDIIYRYIILIFHSDDFSPSRLFVSVKSNTIFWDCDNLYILKALGPQSWTFRLSRKNLNQSKLTKTCQAFYFSKMNLKKMRQKKQIFPKPETRKVSLLNLLRDFITIGKTIFSTMKMGSITV